MNTITTIADIRAALAAHARTKVGLVPTLGAFHAGHEALFRVARRECQVVVASLFVNPTQFNDPADLAAYPRDAARDVATAAAAGVDLLFAPSVEEMYGPHH